MQYLVYLSFQWSLKEVMKLISASKKHNETHTVQSRLFVQDLHSTVSVESPFVLLLLQGNQMMFPQFQRRAELEERSSPPLSPILRPLSFL